MENLFSIFKNLATVLPEFAKRIESVCQKNSLTVNEGLTLLLLFINKETADFCDKYAIDSLKKKTLLDENSMISNKGNLVAKSLYMNIERQNF